MNQHRALLGAELAVETFIPDHTGQGVYPTIVVVVGNDEVCFNSSRIHLCAP